MMLPTGTVTFLFTDIQGSAALAQQHPAELPSLLARHHAILQEAIAAHNGHVFQIVGDAFCAAFSTAGDAVAAARAAQRALQREPWAPAPVVVRMGLHTGAAQAVQAVREVQEVQRTSKVRCTYTYTGYMTLTRVQRVMSAAYGGQVLLSASTTELLRGQLPADVTLRDLGEHRLKSLLNPEHLWQMVAPELRQEFPPLPTLNAIPNNLPLQLSSFIGREQEVADVARLLEVTRLLTLTGAGGAGKTRLSLEVAAEALDAFKDGIWFVELAPLTDPALIAEAVAGVLGLREVEGRSLMETLQAHLRDRSLLLILDNCEHLIEGCAHFADAVLHAGREVRILASSREALGIAGERTWRVPSLPAPDPKAALPVERLEQYAAVQLFVARASFVQPDFRVTNANAPALAQVCWRLDGIPLAIELAAARAKVLSVEEIAARLDDRFRLLTGGGRTVLPRQQTLRATLDWSYGLLADDERVLFRRLAAFVNGWTLEAAEAVCSDQNGAGNVTLRGSVGQVPTRPGSSEEPLLEKADVLDLLSRLVEKSVVTAEPHSGETRYRMLETIREYALERLREAGEEEAVRGRGCAYFLALAERADRLTDSERAPLLDRLEVEHDNLRTALGWLLQRDDSEAALALCNALWYLWQSRGHWTEGRAWYGRAIATSRRAQAGQRVSEAHRSAYGTALDNYGTIAYWQGDHFAAMRDLEEGLAVKRELGEKAGVASILISVGGAAWYQDNALAAQAAWEEGLALYRELDDEGNVAEMLWLLSLLSKERGDYAEAERLTREALAIQRELGRKASAAYALENLGWLAMIAGDYAACQAFASESLALRQEVNHAMGLAWSFNQEGYLAWHQGQFTTARAALLRALALFRKLEINSVSTGPCLIGFAALDVSEGHRTRGVELLGAVAAESKRAGRSFKDIFLRVYEQTMAAAREQMEPDAFDAAWATGCALTMDLAMDLASGG
jgi:predicted ATPase/class 3 adenylate cyclase